MRSVESAEARQHGGIRHTPLGDGAEGRSIGARVIAMARLAAAIHMAQAADAVRAPDVDAPHEGDRS
ncbi:MAG: hypothetical protein ACF8QF_00970 [Phycisphaerales bacterium]